MDNQFENYYGFEPQKPLTEKKNAEEAAPEDFSGEEALDFEPQRPLVNQENREQPSGADPGRSGEIHPHHVFHGDSGDHIDVHREFPAGYGEGPDSAIRDHSSYADQYNAQLAADLREPGIPEDGRRRGRIGYSHCKDTGICDLCGDLCSYKA